MNAAITFSAAAPGDFEELAALRVAAMRESLERVGRFDPERARERLRKSFYPEHTEIITLEGRRIGFHTLRPAEECFYLDHFYLHPEVQSRGIGSFALKRLLDQADRRPLPVRLNALKESAANRFYQRHGFVETRRDEWDVYYERAPLRT